MSSNETQIQRLMEKRDLSEEEARELIDDVQAGATDAVVCRQCGAVDGDDDLPVSMYPNPTTGDESALCSACFAELVEEETNLSPQQAKILALDRLGMTPTEISRRLGIERTNISKQKTRIREKAGEAAEAFDRANKTLYVLEEWDEL